LCSFRRPVLIIVSALHCLNLSETLLIFLTLLLEVYELAMVSVMHGIAFFNWSK
jgi:hypothetical protein